MAKYISPKAIKRQRKIFWTKIILFLIALSLFLFSLSWLSCWEKFNIRNINIEGNSAVEKKALLKIAEKNISGKYFYLFSKSHFLIYPKSKIKKEFFDYSPQIKNVEIEFADFQSITINAEERKPYALWCYDLDAKHPSEDLDVSRPSDDISTTTANRLVEDYLEAKLPSEQEIKEKCYFMDEDAFIYAKALDFLSDVYIKYCGWLDFSATTTDSDILRQTYLGKTNKGQFKKVDLFIRFLKDINVNGYKLIVKENNDYELFFNNDSKLIFDGGQDFNEIFESLRAVLIELSDLENKEFEYIDLRFDNKVLYKFKEQ